MLREHNIQTELFPTDLASQVEELNRDFTRQIQAASVSQEIDANFVSRYRSRDIDEWHRAINFIFADRNFIETRHRSSHI